MVLDHNTSWSPPFCQAIQSKTKSKWERRSPLGTYCLSPPLVAPLLPLLQKPLPSPACLVMILEQFFRLLSCIAGTVAETPEKQNSLVSMVIKTGVTFRHSLDRMWQITVFFVWKAVPSLLCLSSWDLIISTKSQNGILYPLFPYLFSPLIYICFVGTMFVKMC